MGSDLVAIDLSSSHLRVPSSQGKHRAWRKAMEDFELPEDFNEA